MITPKGGGRTLQLLDLVLRVAMGLLALGTVVALGTGPSALRSGGVGIDATVRAPYAVNAPGAVVVDVKRDGTATGPTRPQSVSVHVNAAVSKHDTDTRVAIFVVLLAMLALGWTALVTLWRIVRAARAGNPFDRRNARRLRLLGALLALAAVVAVGGNRVVQHTFDSQGLRPHLSSVDALPVLVVALAMLALAEVFRQGAELREFESATI